MKDQVYSSERREIYYDCLRIVATFAVMILHIATQNSGVDAETFEWKVFNFYDSMVRWAVPVFVMISGALFLSREQSIERIFKKNILRIITAFIFWSAIYAAINLITGNSELHNALREWVEGPTHLWFLFMIVGLYILVPLLQKMVSSVDLTRYFVLVSLIFTFLMPYAVTLFSVYAGNNYVIDKIAIIASSIVSKFSFYFTLGYVSYFVYGYYFSQVKVKGKKKLIIYLLGIIGSMISIWSYVIFPIPNKDAMITFHNNMTLNVMFQSVALFVFAQNNLKFPNISHRAEQIIKKLAEYSFGAYLVHAMVITQLSHIFGLNTLSFNPILSVPVIGVIVFFVSFAISGVFHRIPVLKKYVV